MLEAPAAVPAADAAASTPEGALPVERIATLPELHCSDSGAVGRPRLAWHLQFSCDFLGISFHPCAGLATRMRPLRRSRDRGNGIDHNIYSDASLSPTKKRNPAFALVHVVEDLDGSARAGYAAGRAQQVRVLPLSMGRTDSAEVELLGFLPAAMFSLQMSWEQKV